MKNITTIKSAGRVESKIIIGSATENISKLLPDQRVVIITDANVHLNNMAFINSYEHIVIGQGENSKTLNTVEEVYRQLLEIKADRSTFIIGMGGGVITDITGFAASTYMRGLRFGFISTTLLGQVDASIGGKNGVNLNGYKNIIGLFSQPEFVICDPTLLKSLSEREFRSGMAEAIKAGVIADPELFELIENHSIKEIRETPELLEEVISRSVKVKSDIVNLDEMEKGERRRLNLAHTFAHAIEKLAPSFSHGEAVAAGLVIICEAAARLGKLPTETAARIRSVIEKMGLPSEYPVEMKKLLGAVRLDKKREANHIYLIYPHAIGNCEIAKVSVDSLEEIFTQE